MYTYEEMKSTYGTIKEFCSAYRPELTIVAGVLGEKYDLVTVSEYVKFMNELSIDEFIGNYLNGLLIPGTADEYRSVLDGEQTFYDFVEKYFGKETRKKILKLEWMTV